MPRRIIRWSDLKKNVPFSRQHIHRLEKKGSFPRRVQLGENAVGWFEDEIDAWQENRAEERGETDGKK